MQTISICRKALEDKSGMIIIILLSAVKGTDLQGKVTQDKERALRKIQSQPKRNETT